MKFFLINSACSLCLSILCWLIKCFVLWHITIPYAWLAQLPHYTPDERINLFVGFIAWQIFQGIYVYMIISKQPVSGKFQEPSV